MGLSPATVRAPLVGTRARPDPAGPIPHATVPTARGARPDSALGRSRFTRRYWGNPGWFPFLRLVKCFNSAGSPARSEAGPERENRGRGGGERADPWTRVPDARTPAASQSVPPRDRAVGGSLSRKASARACEAGGVAADDQSRSRAAPSAAVSVTATAAVAVAIRGAGLPSPVRAEPPETREEEAGGRGAARADAGARKPRARPTTVRGRPRRRTGVSEVAKTPTARSEVDPTSGFATAT